MHTLLGLVLLCALNYALIFVLFRYGFLFGGVLAWIFPGVGLLTALIWLASMTHLATVVPTVVVTYFAARNGMGGRQG